MWKDNYMKFWGLGIDSINYASLDLVDDNNARLLWDWGTYELTAPDKPIVVHLTQNQKSTDFPGTGIAHVPAISKNALDVLLPLFRTNVELLQLKCDSAEIYAMRTVVVDCLDYSMSKIEKHPRLTWLPGNIIHAVFKPSCLDGINIFRLRSWEIASVFVSDLFKESIITHELKGAYFTPID